MRDPIDDDPQCALSRVPATSAWRMYTLGDNFQLNLKTEHCHGDGKGSVSTVTHLRIELELYTCRQCWRGLAHDDAAMRMPRILLRITLGDKTEHGDGKGC